MIFLILDCVMSQLQTIEGKNEVMNIGSRYASICVNSP